MKYQIDEGILEMPEGRIDRTVNMLMSPDGHGVSYVVSRDRLEAAETLEQFIARQFKDLSRQVSQFHEQSRVQVPPSRPGAFSGWIIASSFKQHGQKVWQRQAVHVRGDGVSVLIITGTKLSEFDEADGAQWDAVVTRSQLN